MIKDVITAVVVGGGQKRVLVVSIGVVGDKVEREESGW